MAADFFRVTEQGAVVHVRLTPKSSKDAVEGVEETADGKAHLKARVRAVPEDGKANKALEKLLAKTLGVPARDVAVTGGATSRLKAVTIDGDPQAIAASLSVLVAKEA